MNQNVEHLMEADRLTDLTPRPVKSARVLVVACAFNEAPKIGSVLEQLRAVDGIDVLVIDDASSDETPRLIRQNGFAVIHNDRRKGVGVCIRTSIRYFLDRPYEVLVFIAGNNKDRPSEIPRLVEPIFRGENDVVQGSRFLPGDSPTRKDLEKSLARFRGAAADEPATPRGRLLAKQDRRAYILQSTRIALA